MFELFSLVAGDPGRYRPQAEALVAEARLARAPAAHVGALRALAWAERALLRGERAKELLDRAAAVAARRGLTLELAEVLASRAAVLQELGRLAAAQRDLDRAVAIAAGLDGGQLVELRLQQGVLHQNAGRLSDAEALYRALLADPAAAGRVRVIAANNLGLILSQHGRHPAALALLAQAREEAAAAGPAAAALVAQTSAWATVQAGRLPEGLRLFDAAATAYAAAGLPLAEHYVEYVDVLMDLRLLPEAREAARQAGTELADMPLMAAEALLRQAQLALLRGETGEAADTAAAALDSFHRQHRGPWADRARLVRAEARLAAGTVGPADLREARQAAARLQALGTTPAAVQAHLVAGRLGAELAGDSAAPALRRAALDSLDAAAALSRNAATLVRLRGRVAAALAARLRRRDDEALRHCSGGLRDLARHRAALPSLELRTLASGHGAELGRLGLELVLRTGSPARVLGWMERTRAAALLYVEPPEIEEIQDDLAELRVLHAELGDVRGPAGQAPASAALLARQAEIESRIRRRTWLRDASPAAAAQANDMAGLRRSLAGRTLVEYGRVGDDLLAVVVRPHRSSVVRLGSLEQVQRQADGLFFALRRQAQSGRPAASLAAARLSADASLAAIREMLLAPIGLPPGAELVVVPIGPLHGLPWSALHDGPVSLAPSATFWSRTAAAVGAHDGRVVVAAGPGLPGAVSEVAEVSRLHPGATVLRPPESTVSAVAGALQGAGLAHLACHGRLRSDNPMFSALVLSDGLLTVQELDGRGIAPHWIVLAACESGTAVGYVGEELIGFVSALMARGTAGLLASTAAIPDVATAALMPAVHRELLAGHSLARALHAARQTLDTSDPATHVTWCAFNAYGAA